MALRINGGKPIRNIDVRHRIPAVDMIRLIKSDNMKHYLLIPLLALSALSTNCFSQAKTETVVDRLNTLDPGIYYANDTAGRQSQLKANIYSATSKFKLGFGSMMGQMKCKILLSGAQSGFQITDTNPVFYFIFPHENESNFGGAANPDGFLLVKFKMLKKGRELVTGPPSTAEFAVGIEHENRVTFRFAKLSRGVYKVYFDTPLNIGEYAFIFDATGASSSMNAFINGSMSSQKAFDFSIIKQ
jgi:hypothetical protein